MKNTNIKSLIHQRDALLKKFKRIKPFIFGSFVSHRITCRNKNCSKCAGGEKHKAYQLTYKLKGTTKSIYVPVDLIDEVEEWTKEQKRIKRLMSEISDLQKEIIRNYSKEKSGSKRCKKK